MDWSATGTGGTVVVVLGPVSVRRDGRPHDLGGSRPRALAARLALSAGREVSSGELVEAIWGDEPPSSSRKLLHKAAWALRQVLASELATGDDGYVLRVDHDAVDALRLERLVEAARVARAAGDLESAWERLEAAVVLVTGRPLGGLADTAYFAQEARRLEEVVVSAREERLEVGLELGKHEELVAEIESLALRHPYRERITRSLLIALYRSGRQPEALRAYERARRTLVDDLGVDPSPVLAELEGMMLRHDPALQVKQPVADSPFLMTAEREGAGRGRSQEIRFATATDGTRLAYAVSGTGPALIRAANWMTHLEDDWHSPLWGDMLQALSRDCTVIRYDERGCGLSDWDVDRFDVETWIDDLEVVADEVGCERFPLLGVSQGGAVALGFAVRHPERVSRLVLWGAYARGRRTRAVSEAERRSAELDIELARVGWGTDEPTFRQVFTSQFLADGSRAEWDVLNDLQRRSTSTRNAVRFMESFSTIDVTRIAPLVRCPTLVVHSTDDGRVPFVNGRELASLIPGSRMVPVQSRNHLVRAGEPSFEPTVDAVRAFVNDN